MKNCASCKLGDRAQWINDEGGHEIGSIVEFRGGPMTFGLWTLVQPYHGGPPVFVGEYQVRTDSHEEPKE